MQMRERTAVDDLIDALGGTNKAARKLGKTPRAVSQWRKRKRIPSDLFLTVDTALKAAGKPPAAPEVFGMAVPINEISPDN